MARWTSRASKNLPLQPLLAFDAFTVEAGIDDGDAQMVGDVFQERPKAGAKSMGAAAFERDDADDLFFINQRHGDLRMLHLVPPLFGEVIVRVARDIADDDRARSRTARPQCLAPNAVRPARL